MAKGEQIAAPVPIVPAANLEIVVPAAPVRMRRQMLRPKKMCRSD